ncbi:MAG: YHS domain-containing (seleno)protein [Arenimonas sp.]
MNEDSNPRLLITTQEQFVHYSSLIRGLLLSITLVASMNTLAADRIFQTEAGAIRGYDPVAYFTQNKPVLGTRKYTFVWQEAMWHFVTKANRDAFAKEPERYAPSYGGYCAYGMSNGYKIFTSPEAFAIENGKLYLNYSKPVQNTWNKDRTGHIVKANANWTELADQPYKQPKSN